MSIYVGFDPKGSGPFSPFPSVVRPFTDSDIRGGDITFPPGTRDIDIFRAIYPGAAFGRLHSRFNFLSRDAKDRVYKPGEEDPFIFKDSSSIRVFFTGFRDDIAVLNALASTLDIPLQKDKDRNVFTVSETYTADPSTNPYHRDAVSQIVASHEIALKFALCRAVVPGWWINSYAGKEEQNQGYFAPIVDMLAEAWRELAAQKPALKDKLIASVFAEMSDPLDTNSGFPFFESGLEARTKVITTYQPISSLLRGNLTAETVDEVWRLIATLTPNPELARTPLAVAVLRRIMAGYKYQHVTAPTPAGLVAKYDMRGLPTARTAFMFPYLFNLMLTPLVLPTTSYRKILPGASHDGPARSARLRTLRTQKPYLGNFDYSNYDRFQRSDMMRDFFVGMYAKDSNAKYIGALFERTYKNVPLIFPALSGRTDASGLIVIPKKTGLLSGAKHTSTQGTLHNMIIFLAGQVNEGNWSLEEAKRYVRMYFDGSQPGSKWESAYFQSDDTLLIGKTIVELEALMKCHAAAAAKAGIKATRAADDRFLMRHLGQGVDTPVTMRVLQNTLSNEHAERDPVIFLAGLAARTDGMLGQKTIDAFNTGKLNSVPRADAIIVQMVMRRMLGVLKTAAQPHAAAITLVSVILDAAAKMTGIRADASITAEIIERLGADGLTQPVKMHSDYAVKLDAIRHEAIRAVSLHQTNLKADDAFVRFLEQLRVDRNVPSAAMQLQFLQAMNSRASSVLAEAAAKEQRFFHSALSTLAIKPLIE